MVVDDPPDRTTARGFIMPVVMMTAACRGFEDAQESDTRNAAMTLRSSADFAGTDTYVMPADEQS
jgi:hypothetical protein